MYFCFCIVIKGYRNSSEKAVSYFIIKMGGIVGSIIKMGGIVGSIVGSKLFHYKNGWHCWHFVSLLRITNAVFAII
tara:strand:+ start:142 stop:369 length:228 start_codon:yes stop_codon:yes gene_type:complete